jgi:hypothetical protein
MPTDSSTPKTFGQTLSKIVIFLKKGFFSKTKIISKNFEKLMMPIDSPTLKTFGQTL